MLIALIVLAAHVPSVADAQRAVRAVLKDPDSAKFSGIKLEKDDSGQPYGYCGWVNAKNGFGGYTGKASFLYNFRKGKVALLSPELSEPSLCQ